VYSWRIKVLVRVVGRLARLARVVYLDHQVEACRRVFASDTRWTVVRGSDLEEGESQGLPVWSGHVGSRIMAPAFSPAAKTREVRRWWALVTDGRCRPAIRMGVRHVAQVAESCSQGTSLDDKDEAFEPVKRRDAGGDRGDDQRDLPADAGLRGRLRGRASEGNT
jgi:hypothetical protein